MDNAVIQTAPLCDQIYSSPTNYHNCRFHSIKIRFLDKFMINTKLLIMLWLITWKNTRYRPIKFPPTYLSFTDIHLCFPFIVALFLSAHIFLVAFYCLLYTAFKKDSRILYCLKHLRSVSEILF
jgi:hypothetical protein